MVRAFILFINFIFIDIKWKTKIESIRSAERNVEELKRTQALVPD